MSTPSKDGQELAISDARKYEARWSFYKIVAGTMVVGLVAAVLPYFINKEELKNKSISNHQDFIEKFIDSGINQEIEIRLRLAQYFSHLADDDSKTKWEIYFGKLLEHRDSIRVKINKLDSERLNLIIKNNESFKPLTVPEQIILAEINREREWTYLEVGYVLRDLRVAQQENLIKSGTLSRTTNFGGCSQSGKEVDIISDPKTILGFGGSTLRDLTAHWIITTDNNRISREFPIRVGERMRIVSRPDADFYLSTLAVGECEAQYQITEIRRTLQ